MNTNHNIDDLFRKASESETSTEFKASDSVWDRVESQLDKKDLKKSKSSWKKLAIAASLLLFVSLGYQLWDNESVVKTQDDRFENTMDQPLNHQPNNLDDTKTEIPNSSNNTNSDSENPSKSEENGSIMRFKLPENDDVVSSEKVVQKPSSTAEIAPKIAPIQEMVVEKVAAVSEADADFKEDEGRFNANSKTNAMQAKRAASSYKSELKSEETQNAKAPLVVIDNKAITGSAKKQKEAITEIKDASEIDSILYLKEPLYIINGTEYSELELFGANPTSPYAPLQNQDIVEINVLEKPEAVKIYGGKGKKGVVIIRTRNGKPKAK